MGGRRERQRPAGGRSISIRETRITARMTRARPRPAALVRPWTAVENENPTRRQIRRSAERPRGTLIVLTVRSTPPGPAVGRRWRQHLTARFYWVDFTGRRAAVFRTPAPPKLRHHIDRKATKRCGCREEVAEVEQPAISPCRCASSFVLLFVFVFTAFTVASSPMSI